ncbi:hypothetical protein ACKKBG_A13550 [Auxenochlorella protothecoides x Auxenochlorella symbiontica]
MSTLRQRHAQEDVASLLDESEQDAVIQELAVQSARARRQTQLCMTPLGACLALLYLYFAGQALVDPWSIRHHAELRDVLRPLAIAAGDLGSSIAVAAGTWAVAAYCNQSEHQGRAILRPVVVLATLMAVFWSLGILKMLRLRGFVLDGAWRMFWLPAAPAVWTLITLSVINTVGAVERDLRALRAARYRFRHI